MDAPPLADQSHRPPAVLLANPEHDVVVDAKALEARAAAAVAESETKDATRVDSGHDDEASMIAAQEATKPAYTAPLTIAAPPASSAPASSSPLKETLPSFRQLTGQLSELAEAAAATQDARGAGFSHKHSQSLGSATSQSPRLPYHTVHPAHAQTSPVSHYAGHRSPISAAGDAHMYGSPQQQYPTAAYFADRRPSMPADLHFPPSLPSAQSSADSHGISHGSTDGGLAYSTADTTPIESSHMLDGLHRPILPPPPGMPHSAMILNNGFRCDFPGCTAPPFQTQYLLSSHRNVHSQNRPHYCPVKGCPRSEGGKGFKRKNEMIRHGLVHNSPGYICPFCPDREHKYPRPDNLQRHVRVHHVDKDRDDPLLREVLAQRAEGTGKMRRRRTNASVGGEDNRETE